MKKILKLSLLSILTPFFFIACGSKNNVKYSISFGGIGVVYERASDTIDNTNDYLISAKAANGYSLDKSDFTVTAGKKVITSGDNTWNWVDNVLTIRKNIIKDDIAVSAIADLITYSVNVETCEGLNVDSYETTATALKDFVLNLELTRDNCAITPTLKFYENPSDKYELTSSDSINYVFTIKKENICGNINLSFALLADEITVSTQSLSMITYDTKAISYALSKGIETDLVTFSSSDTSLFTVRREDGTKVIEIVSNNNNKSGTGTIDFKYNGRDLITKVIVTITKPENLQEAYDAFTLAAIKLNPNTEFSVTFNFDNKTDISDFNNEIEIYGRRGAFAYDYDIGNRTNRFIVDTSSLYATVESEMEPGDQYYRENAANINYLNRKKNNKEETRIQYIDTVKRTLEVDNSEELFWAVEHGYRPVIPASKTNLSKIYNDAKDMCLSEIDENLTNFEKFRILFEHLESITHYDYWASNDDTHDWWDHQAYFLEGVLNDTDKSFAVCDGFSKAYALLCGIEGLPCVRSTGLYYNTQVKKWYGHAWNYIQLDDNAWYLACPTWCKAGVLLDDSSVVSLMNYEAFATSQDYFRKNGEPFSDSTFPNITRSNTPYAKDKSILEYDELPDNHSYLLNSSSASLINSVIKQHIQVDQKSCVSLTYKSEDYNNLSSLIQTAISGISHSKYDIYTIGMPSEKPTASHDEFWILFIPISS